MTLNGAMALLRYFTEFTYNVVLKQLLGHSGVASIGPLGLGPTFNPAGRARSGQVRLFSRLLLSENNYFDQLNFTFDCHDYIAVTHNRNCNRSSIPSTSSADVCT